MSEPIGPARPKRKHGRTGIKSGSHPNSAKARAPYQWKPGQSGNPAGRPKGSFSAAVRECFKDFDEKQGMSNAQKLVWKCFQLALRGDIDFVRELVDRDEGKPTQRAEFSGPDGSSIPVNLEAIDARLGELLQRARSSVPRSGGKS